MALSTYAELQAEILDWSERAGLAAKAPTFISLAEARLNRELGAVETDATLAGVVGSRELDLSSLSIVQPVALFGTDPANGDEWEVRPQPDGSFPYRDDNARPTIWAVDGSHIDFNVPCDQAYNFRLRYRQKFTLSDAAPTNWLLTNHPDVYLAAALMWGAGYHEDWANGQVWKGILDEAIPSIRRVIAATHSKARLAVDPALASIGRNWRFGWNGVEG